MAGSMQSFDTHGRIKCGTVLTPDLSASLADWRDTLGLELVEEGVADPALAASWGAPASGGRRTALLRPTSGAACYIRLVEGEVPASYRPARSFGWAAYEISVADVFGLRARLEGSGLRVIGEPKNVEGFQTFIPMQAVGSAGEIVYLNQVLNPMSDLDLPKAASPVDHVFIAVLAAADIDAAVRFQVEAIGLSEGQTYVIPYGVINGAFGLPSDHRTTIRMTRVDRLPVVEVDGYPAGAVAREAAPGQLPPGNALVTIAVRSLDDVGAPFLAPPAARDGLLYSGRRAACVRAPGGEVIELLELGA